MIIRKFKTLKVQLPFKDINWGADLADMQLISKFNNRIHFLLILFLFFYVYSKNAWVVPSNDKKRYYNYRFSKFFG